MVAVIFPDVASHESILAKVLSMAALELLVSRFGCKINGIIEPETRKSRNSLVAWCLLEFKS